MKGNNQIWADTSLHLLLLKSSMNNSSTTTMATEIKLIQCDEICVFLKDLDYKFAILGNYFENLHFKVKLLWPLMGKLLKNLTTFYFNI